MRKRTDNNAIILTFAKRKRGKWSFQLIADHFGVSRNVVAGLMFRDKHPLAKRVRSGSGTGSRNTSGTGRHGPGAMPHFTAQNSR